jgi:hypothetical protein
MKKSKRTKLSIKRRQPARTIGTKTPSGTISKKLSSETTKIIKAQSAALRKAVRPFVDLLWEFRFVRTGWHDLTIIFTHEENTDEEIKISVDRDWNVQWSFSSSKLQDSGSDIDSLQRMLLFDHQRRVIQLGATSPS